MAENALDPDASDLVGISPLLSFRELKGAERHDIVKLIVLWTLNDLMMQGA